MALRQFGLFCSDLDVDFDQSSRPRLVTQILQCCTIGKDGYLPDQDFFWDLASSKRIECLVAIATLGGSSGLTVFLRCPSETCLQEMELEISLEELASVQRQTDNTDRFLIRLGNETLPIRRPTGWDQLNWSKISFDDEDVATRAMIQTLLLEQAPIEEDNSGEWMQGIDRTMGELDPLVNFTLLVSCPGCGTENRYEVDLQEIALDLLRQNQLGLLQAVHRLALHYHWSEEQIFSLPPWRFSRYLALIENEEEQ